MNATRRSNRLIRESSPYLLQHAHNPVDWFPWGDEAFAAARAGDKPILLSVGYSACHWCHVMERECFEDEAIASLMNEHFVCIKVDREERPDVDHVYMTAVQALTGRGGWPMTVFLTPDGVPFYGGTYFPPEDRHGLPGFPRVLTHLAEAYRTRRADIESAGRELLAVIRNAGAPPARVANALGPRLIDRARRAVAGHFDAEHGGTAGAPKFPQPGVWEFMLRAWKRSGDTAALDMVRSTLTRMARGGIYDRLGGGFHRYSVDEQWLVPHFEKMLYDNGQLASLYLHGWLAAGDAEYRRVVEETLDYITREMTDPSGGFYSAQDADSEGEEGKFFVWTADEVEAAIGDRDLAAAARAAWGLDAGPNFEGRSILFVAQEPADTAARLGIGLDELSARLAEARRRLAAVRERRVRPGRDDKVLAGWNGLALSAFAEAGRALGREDYLETARRSGRFLVGRMIVDHRLQRTWKAGAARLNGYLEDYALVGRGLLGLYEATLEPGWLAESRQLADAALRLFWDERERTFYDTGTDHETLIVRPRDRFDDAVPSGVSSAAEWLLRLHAVTGHDPYQAVAREVLTVAADIMAQHPTGAARYLAALDFHLGPVTEIALVWPAKGKGGGADELLSAAFGRYAPNQVVVGAEEGHGGLPLLEGKRVENGKPTAYVCRDRTCRAPVTDAAGLMRELE